MVKRQREDSEDSEPAAKRSHVDQDAAVQKPEEGPPEKIPKNQVFQESKRSSKPQENDHWKEKIRRTRNQNYLRNVAISTQKLFEK